jgi:FkbM family methyltransferase
VRHEATQQHMHLLDRVSAECHGACLPSVVKWGCLHPAPVSRQCSFAYANATALCATWKRCAALNCNVLRDDCQARDQFYRLVLSFGESHAFVRAHPRRPITLADDAKAYRQRFASDYFVHDAVYVYRNFFRGYGAPGFFVESGALDGTVFGSNSYYFERYLGWRGLLVEASPSNCAKLVRRRNSSRVKTLCTALCSINGPTLFSAEDGCCGTTGQGSTVVRCTQSRILFRTYNVSRIDFWSLDVEGAELDVLRGVDWSVPIYVLLIESVTPPIRDLLTSKGFRNHPFRSPSRLNEIWVNGAHRRTK